MTTETYTPGHSNNAVNFMAQRRLSSHGAFFLPYLKPNLTVLDCGCGPGTITLDIARAVPNGSVTGVDFSRSQVEIARQNAVQAQMVNVIFEQANAGDLPFPTHSFDAVFSHALLEHLANPLAALLEFRRVLKPGGLAAICSPDWRGFLLAPPSPALDQAIEAYKTLQSGNGGDVYVGSKFGALMGQAGYQRVQLSARYECYASLGFIGEYLAGQLEQAGKSSEAETLRVWSQSPVGMFAQAWVSCVGYTR